MAHKIVIQTWWWGPSADPKRARKQDRTYLYTSDGWGPYMVIVPDEDFTEQKLTAAIKAQEAKRDQFVGKEFEV